MAGAVVSGILGKFGEFLFGPIKSEFDYLFCFDINIQKLQTQLRDLKATREGVQLWVEEARNNLRSVPEADTWLIEANNKIAEADTIIESEARLQTECLNGWCGPRYSLSKKAANITPDLVHLHTEGIKYTQLSRSPPPPSIQALPSTRFKGFESRNFIVNQIIEALKDDEINLVGLCGMGGVGKTTMVKHVAERVKEEKLFNEVAMAVVSQGTNLNQVRRHIAKMLGLKLDDLKPDDILEEQVSHARASLLRKRLLLDNKKILVILDDIWEEFDLEELGFPLEGGSNKNCKMLFTSRNRNLWKGIPNKRYIQLEVLVGEEPWHLFSENIGDCVDDLDLLPLAKDIVNECGGLPLALATIGRALTNEHSQHHWKNALQQLRNPCSESLSSEVPAKVYEALCFSYNFLKDDRAKKLFLLCCLFPEDYEIPIEDLVRYGIGLRWFEGIGKVDEVRDRVNVLVDQLKSCYLLLGGDEGEEIKMHDVVRDVAISIAAKDKHGFMIIHGAKSREWPKKATYELNTSISVISDEIAEFPGGLRCSKLEFLLIQCWNSSLKIPSNFFEGMGELKVLDQTITEEILLLPSSLQFLSNLLTLHLDYCQKFDNISVIGKLSNLEILSFRRSDIEELPEQIRGLVNLKLLDLTRCRELKRIAPGVISALVHLQELYMGDCTIIWEREGKEGGENASLREFESLSNLNTLAINIEDVKCLPRIPLFSKLTKYSICIGWEEESFSNFSIFAAVNYPVRKLLKLCGQCTIPSECVNPLLRSSAVLELRGMGSEDAVQELFREGVEGLQHLKDLVIDDCATPECFVNTMEWVPRTPNAIPHIFPILEKLELVDLPNLKKICHCQLSTGSFGKLKHLKIKNCDRMEEVIWKEKGEDEATSKMKFPALESMTLEGLPMLIGFCRGTGEIEFPQLKKLSLGRLPQLKWLFLNSSNPFSESMENHNATFRSLFSHKVALPSLEELKLSYLDNLDPISVGSFSKLRKVHVEHCDKLLCVFPSQFLTRLRNLEDLTVENCSLLEKVFELEMVDCKEQESEMLSLLKSLKLKHLPQLDYISKRDPIGFTYISQLSILHVHDCDNLRYLFPHSMKCMLQLQELDIRRCKMMSRIVADEKGQGKSSMDKIGFAQLKILRLYDLPNLVSFFPKVIVTSATSTERHQNVMQTLFNEKVVFPTLEVVELERLDNLDGLGHIPISVGSFSKLRKVHVKHCGKFLYVFPSQFLTRLRNLEDLTVENCSLLEKVFELEMVDGKEQESENLSLLKSLNEEVECSECFVNTTEWVPRTPNAIPPIFPILEELRLCNLPVLRKICHCQLPTGSFVKLKHLEINNCDRMEEVIWKEKGEDATNKMEFPALKSMTLWGLPMLIGFCRGTDEIEFPQLKILHLRELPQLKWLFLNSNNPFSESMKNHNDTFLSLFPHKVALPSLEELELKYLDNLEGLRHIPISMGSSFPKLRKLSVEHCGKWLYVSPSQFLTRLPNLQELSIRDCSLLEEVADCTEHNSKIFPLLKSLKLKSPPQLNHISERNPIGLMYILPRLSILHIDDFDNLRFLFSQSMTQCILQLEELEIRGCKMMSTIFREEDSHGEILVDNIEFTQLKILRLHDLQNLVSIFPKVTTTVATSSEHIQNPGQSLFNEKVAFPSLEELELHGLQNMNEIWCNQLQIGSFNKLITLYVSDCGSLRNMFSPFMARHLVHLERLVINKCSMMEEVVAEEDEDKEEEGRINRTPLPKLEYLKLIDLPELKSFFHVTHDWELPLIADVTIFNCPKMKTFSHGVICTPKLQRVFVKQGKYTWSPGREGEDWLWISDLNQTILHLIEKQQEEQVQQHLQQQEHEVGEEEGGEKEETNDNNDDGGDVYKKDGDSHN